MADEAEVRAAVETIAGAAGEAVGAAAALEAAEQRADDAQDAAEDLADAVYRDALVKEISAFKTEIETWRGGHETRMLTLENLLAEIQASQARTAELLAGMTPPTVTVVTAEPETDQSLIPAPLPPPAQTVVTVEPASAAPAPTPDASAAPARRRVRFL